LAKKIPVEQIQEIPGVQTIFHPDGRTLESQGFADCLTRYPENDDLNQSLIISTSKRIK
jgi:hypothetical protein